MGKDMKTQIFGAAVLSIAFLASLWALASLGFNGLTLSGLQWVVGALIILGGTAYMSMGFLTSTALNADSKHRAPGGMKGAINVGLVLLIVVVAAFAGIGIYSILQPKAAQTITGTQPTPGTSTGAQPIQVFTGPTYTLSNTSYDADTQTAISASAVTAYTNPATGAKVSIAGLPISPGIPITLRGQASNYFDNIQVITTPNAVVSFSQKAIDTTLSFTAYDDNDRSQITGTENLTIGNGSSAVAHVKVKQSANYKHPTGDSLIGCVFVNATAGEEVNYDSSSMSASWDSRNCVEYGSAAAQALLGTTARPASAAMTGSLVAAYVCTGVDFAQKDAATHLLDVKYAAASGVNPGAENKTGVNFVGADYFTDQTGKLSTKPGCVTDTGAAIHAIQSIAIPVD